MNQSEITHCPEYFNRYIHKTDDIEFKEVLQKSLEELKNVPLTEWGMVHNKVYAEGKWNLKQILQHLIDTERIFTYRALAFARKDKETIPSYNENEYAISADVTHRKLEDLIREYIVVREGLILLFHSFTSEMLLQVGTMVSGEISVLAFPFILAGHQRRHFEIIKERYLSLL